MSRRSPDDAAAREPARRGGARKPRLAAPWAPGAATVAAALGLTSWLAPRGGAAALALPLFGADAGERRAASRGAWDLTSAFLIWTAEGYRAGSGDGAMTPLAVPCTFGAAVQMFGIDKVAPVYYIFTIVAGSRDLELAGDPHRVDPDVAKAVLPATILGHVLPVALLSSLPMTATEVSRSCFTAQSIVCHLFYFSPIAVSALTTMGSQAIKWFRRKFGSEMSTHAGGPEPLPAEESHDQHGQEVPALKTAYAVAFGLQAFKHLSTAAWVLRSYRDAMSRIPALSVVTSALGKLLERPGGATTVGPLGWGYYKLATVLFGLHTAWDLRRRGYTTTDETVRAVVLFSGLLGLCGTGAGYAGLWYWREGVLDGLRRRAKPASPE